MFGRNNHIKERSEFFTIDAAVRVDGVKQSLKATPTPEKGDFPIRYFNVSNGLSAYDTGAMESGVPYGKGGNEKFRGGEDIEAVNERFNDALFNLTEKNADNTNLLLGRPSDILKSVGIPDRDIVLYGNKLIKKAKKHRYNFQDIRDLPKLLITAICIFGGSSDGSFAILTEMIVNGKRSIVSIDINKGEVQDVNLVTSIYDKRNESIIRWI